MTEIDHAGENEPGNATRQKTPPACVRAGTLIAGIILARGTGAETGNPATMPAVVGRRTARRIAAEDPHATPLDKKNRPSETRPADAMAEAAKPGTRAPNLKPKQPTVGVRASRSCDPLGIPTLASGELLETRPRSPRGQSGGRPAARHPVQVEGSDRPSASVMCAGSSRRPQFHRGSTPKGGGAAH